MKSSRRLILPALLVAIAFAPVLTSLISWNLVGKLSAFQYQVRHRSYPTLVLEIGVVLLALASGFSIAALLRNLSQWQRRMLWLLGGSALVPTLLTAPDRTLACQAAVEWAIHLVFAASVVFLAQSRSELFGPWFWKAFVAGTLCYVALVFVFVAAVPHPDEFPWVLRMPGVTNVRHIGYVVSPVIGALVAYYFFAGRSATPVFTMMILGVLVCFGCWTGSRGPFFSLAAVIPLTVYVYPEFRSFRSWAIIISVMVSAALVSAAMPTPAPGFGLISRLFGMVADGAPEFSSGRIAVWKLTLEAIWDHPWVGFGAGQYRTIMAGVVGMPLNHPHNIFLQILFQWGLLGAVAFFSLLASAWWVALRNALRRGVETAPSFLVLNALLAFSLIDGTGNYPFPIVLMLMALGDLLKSSEASTTRFPAS